MLYNSKTPQDIALSFWSSIFSRSQCSNSFLIEWSRHNCCYAVSKLMRFLAEKHLLTKCNEHMYVVFTSFQRRPFLLVQMVLKSSGTLKKISVIIMAHSVLAALPWKMKSLCLSDFTQSRQNLLIFWNKNNASQAFFSVNSDFSLLSSLKKERFFL